MMIKIKRDVRNVTLIGEMYRNLNLHLNWSNPIIHYSLI